MAASLSANGEFEFHTSATYFQQLEKWLAMEGEAERERLAARRHLKSRADAERTGETLIGLKLVDLRTGLAGRLLLDFVKVGGEQLPMNRLKVGSPVVVSDDIEDSGEFVGGVVSKRTQRLIQVAIEREVDADQYRLDLSADDSTRTRQLAAMANAQLATGSQGRLRDCLLGFQEPRFNDSPELDFLSSLNPPQEEAVRFALSAKDVAIIHGPPGTGKTTTLAEVIYQAVKRGQQVLACAPSNTAVDNMLEKLVAMLPNVLRVGHPARVFESLRGHTLDELVEADSSTKIVREMKRDIEELMRAACKQHRGRGGGREKGLLYAEAGRLRKEARALERRTIRHIVDSADVICTTTTIDEDLLSDRQFDLVIIDEACQCTEPAIWQAALRANTVIFGGDHCQLPPTVVSIPAARQGFSRSSMERLIDHFDKEIYRRLRVQYRMNTDIMEFSSEHFYDGDLIADASVKNHRLSDLEEVEPSEKLMAEEEPGTIFSTALSDKTIEFWDTAGAEWNEELEPDGLSKCNPKEANWVVQHVRALLHRGLRAQDIAVIAPYAAQVRLLRNRLQMNGLEIDTVDGFQGREKEAVIVTFVRSNSDGEIGFLSEARRTNVALTRAKRHLRVIGDSSTLSYNDFYKAMIEYFEHREAYHTVWELTDQA